jgi:hypothetical protein
LVKHKIKAGYWLYIAVTITKVALRKELSMGKYVRARNMTILPKIKILTFESMSRHKNCFPAEIKKTLTHLYFPS